MNRRFVPWILSVVLVTLFCLLLLFVLRSVVRQGANDPQVQIAEDVARVFSGNQFTDETLRSSFETFVPSKMQVDIGLSLSPWIQVYDASGEVIASSATIQEAQTTPRVSTELFEGLQKRDQIRLTWKPQKGIRQAIVITKFSGLRSGYVVVGRSLREAEDQIRIVTEIISATWFVMVFLIACVAVWTFGYFTTFTKQKQVHT
jgi:hypothetical protein